MSGLGDRRLLARSVLALALANLRYWTSVWPLAQAQLRRWELRARAIEHPELRELALGKLHNEAFNAEVAATLATLAPTAQRADAVEAIIALELLFDFLDGLTERPMADPLGNARSLFRAFTDAVEPDAAVGAEYHNGHPGADDAGYIGELSGAVRRAIARLPGGRAIEDAARRSAARCAQAQIRIHAEPSLGTAQLQEWAERESRGTGLGWRELAAGAASSVLALHALIAAAADQRSTPEEAIEIETAYLSICVLITVLDSLVDYDEDMRAGEPGFIRFYEDRGLLAETLAGIAARAEREACALRNGAHHVMTLAGVIAYYTSAPSARGGPARPVAARLQRELAPLIYPTLGVMHAWRLAKRARGLVRTGIRGQSEG